MRRKFELKVCYTFNGCFTLRAASGKDVLFPFQTQNSYSYENAPRRFPPCAGDHYLE